MNNPFGKPLDPAILGMVRSNDPATSVAAAQNLVASGKLQKREQQAIDYLKMMNPLDGATCREMSDYYFGGKARDSFTPRMMPLYRKGLVQGPYDYERDSQQIWILL